MSGGKWIIFVLVALAMFKWASTANAEGIGNLETILDVTYTIDDSFDGVSGDDYMVGGGLRLDFDIALGFSAGVDYTYSSKTGELFQTFDTDYSLHSLKAAIRWRYAVTSWFEPYVMFLVGPDFHNLRIDSGLGNTIADIDSKVTYCVGGVGGLRFQLAESWMASWKPWNGFNLGLFTEVGYLYHGPFSVSYEPNPLAEIEGARATGMTLGKLKTGGPVLRFGVYWSF